MGKSLRFLYCLFWSGMCSAVTSDYEQINSFLHCYQRPVTFLGVLDEKSDAQLIVELARKHTDSVFVCIGAATRALLADIPHNVVLLKPHYTKAELDHLRTCEHFDFIFIKSKRFVYDVQEQKLLYTLGEHVLLALADTQELAVNKDQLFLPAHKGGMSYYYVFHPITFLLRTQWLEQANEENAVRRITSTFKKKVLYKNYGPKPMASFWLPGINLMSFKMLEGSVPTTNQLRAEVARTFTIPHLDWMPNNIVVQGASLALIDFDPVGSQAKTVCTPEMLRLMIQFVSEPASQNIPERFRELLFYCYLQIHGDHLTAKVLKKIKQMNLQEFVYHVRYGRVMCCTKENQYW